MLDEMPLSAIRMQGRAAKPISAEVLRDITPADISLLGAERGTRPSPIAKIRERHHSLARALASGMRDHEAAAITGYSPSRISILKADPSFQELLEGYKAHGTAVFADFVAASGGLAIAAVQELTDRLEETPEDFTHGQLLEVIKTTADRSGNAPVTRSVSVNANVDLGDRLSAARRRVVALAEPKLLGGADVGSDP